MLFATLKMRIDIKYLHTYSFSFVPRTWLPGPFRIKLFVTLRARMRMQRFWKSNCRLALRREDVAELAARLHRSVSNTVTNHTSRESCQTKPNACGSDHHHTCTSVLPGLASPSLPTMADEPIPVRRRVVQACDSCRALKSRARLMTTDFTGDTI